MQHILKLIYKFVNKETISYIIFGILTTLVDTISFYISNDISKINYIFSTVFAWFLAVTFAYITNKVWVFKSDNFEIHFLIKEFVSFIGARILSLVFTIVWMMITVEIFELNKFMSKVLANIFVVIINYFISKLYIFKSN